MSTFASALEIARENRSRRDYPAKDDPRCVSGLIFPEFRPKFEIDFGKDCTVFTIGSCFARNIEEALEPLGVDLPTRRFSVPKAEWGARPNGLLNEFNPGTISQRILDAVGDRRSPDGTVVETASGWSDLLLLPSPDVSRERAMERRDEIFEIYASLQHAKVVIITLGLIEAWFDAHTGYYLNRMPPANYAKLQPNRFNFQRLDVFAVMPLMEKALDQLAALGIKVILTVSPVPLRTTFAPDDGVVANEFSKSVLRVCAERLSQNFKNVDYFPSYEIVRSGGLAAYVDDQVHVRDEVVSSITSYMVECYRKR